MTINECYKRLIISVIQFTNEAKAKCHAASVTNYKLIMCRENLLNERVL